MGGRPSQFGIDESEMPAAIALAGELGIECAGLHFFLGSQLRSTEAVVANIETARVSALGLAKRTGMSLSFINLCGGFGIPHTLADPVLDLETIADAAHATLDEIRQTTGSPVTGMIEAGRYIFGDAGVYRCRVVETKRSRGTLFVIVDVGISGFSRPAVAWGEQHPVWKLGDPYLEGDGTQCVIVGPTCLPGDVIASGAWLQRPEEGDTLVVGNAGAYGYSMSLLRWASLPMVDEVVL
jgi:diaminopimelate decarboxylase